MKKLKFRTSLKNRQIIIINKMNNYPYKLQKFKISMIIIK